MKRSLLCILFAVTIFAILSPTFGENEKQAKTLPDQLVLPQKDNRVASAEELAQLHAAISHALVENLKKHWEDPLKEYQGPLHLTIQTIGAWRIEEAVPTLMKIISCRLDPSTFPVGARFQLRAYYPAADALAKIGGNVVIEAVLRRAEEPSVDDDLRECAWVHREILGKDATPLIIEARQNKTQQLKQKENLSKVLEFARETGPILSLPKQ